MEYRDKSSKNEKKIVKDRVTVGRQGGGWYQNIKLIFDVFTWFYVNHL